MKLQLSVFVIGAAASALGFFDGFQGSSLESHWDVFSEGSGWEHSVSGGELSVARLHGPFNFNEVGLSATVEGYSDFQAEARVFWSGHPHQTISFGLSNDFPFMNPRIASLRYDAAPGGMPGVTAFVAGGSGGFLSNPTSGWHTFRIERSGSSVSAYLDGLLVGSADPGSADSANKVFLHFGGPDLADFGNLRVDFVSVVPEPATIASFTMALLAIRKKRAR